MIWDRTFEAEQIDRAAEAAGQRWTALVARIDQAAAADYVCDQLRAELMTDGTALCYELSHLCEYPPDLWSEDEPAALMSSLEAAALGKALVRAMCHAMCAYLATLGTEEG